MSRCKWCNLKNPLYIKYHDEEWCKPNFNEKYLFEMLIKERILKKHMIILILIKYVIMIAKK